jgi:hypothetical protein
LVDLGYDINHVLLLSDPQPCFVQVEQLLNQDMELVLLPDDLVCEVKDAAKKLDVDLPLEPIVVVIFRQALGGD